MASVVLCIVLKALATILVQIADAVCNETGV